MNKKRQFPNPNPVVLSTFVGHLICLFSAGLVLRLKERGSFPHTERDGSHTHTVPVTKSKPKLIFMETV